MMIFFKKNLVIVMIFMLTSCRASAPENPPPQAQQPPAQDQQQVQQPPSPTSIPTQEAEISQPSSAQPEAPPNGPPDLAVAAAQLGISEQQLREALGPPPPDLAAAAAKLGLSEEALRQALDAAMSGGNSPAAPAATNPANQDSPANTDQIPVAYTKFLDNVSVRVEGDFVIIESDGVPPHPSPYFPRNDNRYELYTGSKPFAPNPSQIEAYQATYRLPLHPQQAAQVTQTPGGIMGVALDGVALFNQYAARRSPLDEEIVSFDQYNGHPQQDGIYHYHLEPLYLSQVFGPQGLMGFLLDGFPVYGPYENEIQVKSSDLDEYHGHFHPTEEYPEGVYHYHVTDDAPYINGIGFYGVPGSVTCNFRCSSLF